MENLVVILIVLCISSIISFFWVRGIDYMHKNHPDYKGEDLFGNMDIDKTAGRDGWDDNLVHSEGDF
jgi:hypothetical protein